MNLEGDKISTSRNWAVWLHEYLEEFPGKQDVLRYVLTTNAPETKDNDFTWKDFQARNNNELLSIFGNFVNRTMVLAHKFFGGTTPPLSTMTALDRQVLDAIPSFPGRIGDSLDHFRFREALGEMMNLARLGNKYLTDAEPWKIIKTDPERVKTILNISLQICANLAVVSEPFLPFTAERLVKMLNIPAMKWPEAGQTDLIKSGHQLGKPEYLFEKIEDAVIKKQIQKLMDAKMQNAATARHVPPQKDIITYDDFARMDIRVSTVLEAERVPKSDKLMKLLVDTGIDRRTVVAGIAGQFAPEQVVGRQVLILVNLEPRALRGVESQGMILMAENGDGTLCFIGPAEPFDNGSGVK
jgi:methionyl-tRNA synthetase